MTIRVMVHATIHDGSQEPFESAFALVRAKVAGTPGHLEDQLLRSATDPTAYVLLSQWESREQFLAWEDAPIHRELTTPMRPFWAGKTERTIFDVQVSDAPARSTIGSARRVERPVRCSGAVSES